MRKTLKTGNKTKVNIDFIGHSGVKKNSVDQNKSNQKKKTTYHSCRRPPRECAPC